MITPPKDPELFKRLVTGAQKHARTEVQPRSKAEADLFEAVRRQDKLREEPVVDDGSEDGDN